MNDFDNDFCDALDALCLTGSVMDLDTLGKLLTIELHDIDKNVTVKQLLTHTSGVPDYFDETTMNEYEELWTDYPNYKIRHNSDLLPLFINKPMMYPKGKDLAYFQGCDPRVSFLSEYNPNNGMISVLVSNYGDNVWKEIRKIREGLY